MISTYIYKFLYIKISTHFISKILFIIKDEDKKKDLREKFIDIGKNHIFLKNHKKIFFFKKIILFDLIILNESIIPPIIEKGNKINILINIKIEKIIKFFPFIIIISIIKSFE